MKKTAQYKRKPELKFIEASTDEISKKHANDFKGVTTQNLSLEEARAIFANLPEFRKDQVCDSCPPARTPPPPPHTRPFLLCI